MNRESTYTFNDHNNTKMIFPVIMLAIIMSIIPLTEIIVGANNFSIMKQCNSTFIGINTWIIVNGINTLVFTSCVMFAAYKKITEQSATATFIILGTLHFLYLLLWLFMGTFEFVTNCYFVKPDQLNYMTWVALLYTYIIVIIGSRVF